MGLDESKKDMQQYSGSFKGFITIWLVMVGVIKVFIKLFTTC